VRSETKQTVIPHRENMLRELVTLSEMTELVTMHPDKILRLGASGEIQCFSPITIEKIEVGTLAVVPTNEKSKVVYLRTVKMGVPVLYLHIWKIF
jgi:hypothetical protein